MELLQYPEHLDRCGSCTLASVHRLETAYGIAEANDCHCVLRMPILVCRIGMSTGFTNFLPELWGL